MMETIRRWTTTAIGLATIPLIITPIDRYELVIMTYYVVLYVLVGARFANDYISCL